MRRIVVGYDGSEHAWRALERSAELARGGATVTVVTAVPPLPSKGFDATAVDPSEVSEHGQQLEDAEAFLRERGVDARAVGARGDPADVIVEEARESAADLIVLGPRDRNLLERLLLGSVSSKVIHDAPCDVLLVR